MARKKQARPVECTRVELEGVPYVILRAAVFEELCRQAQAVPARTIPSGGLAEVDGPSLAEKLIRRRRSVGLSQAELARRAGVRPETLNRIERGKTTPDFATVRKLVLAMNEAEQRAAEL